MSRECAAWQGIGDASLRRGALDPHAWDVVGVELQLDHHRACAVWDRCEGFF